MCPPSDIRSPVTRAAAKVAQASTEDASKLGPAHAKLEPHQLARTFTTRWVRVGDVEYDVTNFKHPGGSVIFYMLANTGAWAGQPQVFFLSLEQLSAALWGVV